MSKLKGLHLYFLSAIVASIASNVIPSTSYCEIHDRNLGFIYNFKQLARNNKEDIIIKHDYPNETIHMQLCSPLIKKCNNQDGYAICLTKDKLEKGIGKFPPQVSNNNGKILFNFTGDNCIFQTNYTVHIIMQCDYQAENNTSPELFPHANEQCNLFMVWKTTLACGPRTQTNCTVVHNNEHYDLSPLTRYSENYVIRISTGVSPKIVLNVCHSVIRQHDAVCPTKTGACLYDSLKSNRYLSLGEVQNPPYFSGDYGHLIIEYKNGGVCNIPNITTSHVQTTIIFICDLQATETIPEYIWGKHNCNYFLMWHTAAACSVEYLRKHRPNTAGECIVTNPVTNFTYNLQSLMNKDFTVTNKNGTEYKFRICGSLIDNNCKAGTGACDTKHGLSLGEANTFLMFEQGGPYLYYTNGDLCDDKKRHYTVIEFFCGPEKSVSTPLLVEEYPCKTVIHWNTNLVCEKRIKCATDDDDEINLTPLIRSTNNYVVKVNDTEFHINICRPLVPTRGLTCTHGSAVCKVSVTSKGEYTNETSLGFPENSPTLNKDLQTVLRYIGGSQCPEKPAKLISSNFTFVCDNNNQGLPVYKHYVDCTYVFEWHTSIACGAVMGTWTPSCTIKDGFLSREYDLSLLYVKQHTHYVKGRQGKEFGISICGGEKYCNGSAVCHETNGYGTLRTVIFDYSRDDIKLKYSNGSKCNNNSYTSEIRFICNESMGIGAPKLLLESQCSAEFEWQTEVICAKHANSQSIPDTNQEEQSSTFLAKEFSPSHAFLFAAGAVAGVVLTVIAVLAALLYFRNPEKRACFRTWTNLFYFRRGSGRVQYCRVDTTEEARLLLDATDPTQCQTDSDDDLLHA